MNLLSITDLKAYVPAKDFELSKQFYGALGFEMSDGWGGTADFKLNGFQFRLQPYYVKEWADNFMITMGVEDIDAWHARVLDVARERAFSGVRVTAPEAAGDALVLHVVDPSGVLLIFVQRAAVGV